MRIIVIILLFSLILVLSGCGKLEHPSVVDRLSVSSNGNYVITGNEKGDVILWNIKKRTYRIIARNGNPLSVYFIKGTNKFLWQDKYHQFHVETVDGDKVLSLKAKHPSVSTAMTNDLRYLIHVDNNWVKRTYDTKNKQWKIVDESYLGGGGEVMNLALASNSKTFLTSGFCGDRLDDVPLNKPKGRINLDCVVLWNVATGKPIKKFWGNVSQTYATLSPSTEHVIAGGLDDVGYIWDSKTGKLLQRLWYLSGGIPVKYNPDHTVAKFNKKGLIPKPKDFFDAGGSSRERFFSINFLSSQNYLRLTIGIAYAVLYKGLDPKPTKYFHLGKMPYPSVTDLSRDGSIDSSPSAHILVTGQAGFNGINVYQYDPKTETLYRVWTPIINPPKNIDPLSKDVPTLPGVKFEDLTKVKRVGW